MLTVAKKEVHVYIEINYLLSWWRRMKHARQRVKVGCNQATNQPGASGPISRRAVPFHVSQTASGAELSGATTKTNQAGQLFRYYDRTAQAYFVST